MYQLFGNITNYSETLPYQDRGPISVDVLKKVTNVERRPNPRTGGEGEAAAIWKVLTRANQLSRRTAR